MDAIPSCRYLICVFCMFVGDPQLHMQAVISVLLSTFAGLGITMCGTSFLGDVFSWRRRWALRSSQQPQTQGEIRQDQPAATAHQNQTDPHHHEIEPTVLETVGGN